MLKAMEHPSSIQSLRNSLLGNLFISSGEPGPVLKIHCKGRTGPKNLVKLPLKKLWLFLSIPCCSKVTCMREILAEAWPSETLGLGGIFRIVSGKVDFCKQIFSHFFKSSSDVHDLQVKMCFSLTGQVPRYARLLSLSNPQ